MSASATSFEAFLLGRRLPPPAPPSKEFTADLPIPAAAAPADAASQKAAVTMQAALAVPDFDAPPLPPGPSPEEIAARQAQLNAARANGHAEGRAEALAEAEGTQQAAVAIALGAIADSLTDAASAAQHVAADAAQELARLLLAALDAALPAAAARLAPETARQLAELCLPVLDHAPRLTLHVAPGLAEACAAQIGDARVMLEEDPDLAPGDVRAEWKHGSAVRELAAQRQAVDALLAALDLKED